MSAAHEKLCNDLKELARKHLYSTDTQLKIAVFEQFQGKNTASYVSMVKLYMEEIEREMDENGDADDFAAHDPFEKAVERMEQMKCVLDNCTVLRAPMQYGADDDAILENVWHQYLLSLCVRRRPMDNLVGVLILGRPKTGKSTFVDTLRPYQVPNNQLGVGRFADNNRVFVLEDWTCDELVDKANLQIVKQLCLGQPTTEKVAGSVQHVGAKWIWMTSNCEYEDFRKLPDEIRRRWVVVKFGQENGKSDSGGPNFDVHLGERVAAKYVRTIAVGRLLSAQDTRTCLMNKYLRIVAAVDG